MEHELSERQRVILEFIQASYDQSGVVPSYREIGAALGIKSTNAVSDHLKALMRKGYLERVGPAGNSRSIRLTEGASVGLSEESVVNVPVLGRVAAGVPLLAEENYEGSIRWDRSLVPSGGQIFALRVRGDSMIDDGIHDGDTLLVRQKSEARNGEIAVVLVDGEATVKRVQREGSLLRLIPANSAMTPRVVDLGQHEASIVGVAIGLWRRIVPLA